MGHISVKMCVKLCSEMCCESISAFEIAHPPRMQTTIVRFEPCSYLQHGSSGGPKKNKCVLIDFKLGVYALLQD